MFYFDKGSVYEGYFTRDQSKERIILKAYKRGHFMRPHQSFLNEVAALKKLSRLLVSDTQNKIVIQTKIHGDLLGDVLNKCFKVGGRNQYEALIKNNIQRLLLDEKLKENSSTVRVNNILKKINYNFKSKEDETKYHRLVHKYFDLFNQFHEKHGMIHNDIHPNNVIVNSDEELVLIDFGRTVPISNDPITAQAQKDFDTWLAESNIYGY